MPPHSPPELAVRLRRLAFNRALADADLTAISAVLAPDAVLVAGTDSALIVGRKAQLQAWKREFAGADRAVYTRTPEAITLSPIHPIAFEHGAWQGVRSSSGTMAASGTYSAKWRQFGDSWLIEAELYLTLAEAGPVFRSDP
jgi:ketosteroid isomerase-like protein